MITAQGKQIGVTPGLTVQFSGLKEGFFDSDSIKHAEHREIVEEFLREHEDNGVLYHIEGEPTEATKVSAPVQETVVPPDPATATCVATIVEPGKESRLCGNPADPETHLCEECSEQTVEVSA